MTPNNPPNPERSERPTPPRFSTFNFNRLLSARQTSSSGSRNVLATNSAQTVPGHELYSEPSSPHIDTVPFYTILDIVSHRKGEASSLVAHMRSAISQLPVISPTPTPDLVHPALLNACAPTSPLDLRCAGFDLMTTYLTNAISPTTDLSSINRVAFWLIIRDAGPGLGGSLLEWRCKSSALGALLAEGREVDGIHGLVPYLCGWAEDSFSRQQNSAKTSDNMALTATEADGCFTWTLTLLNDILRQNGQGVSSSEVESVVRMLDRMVNEAIEPPDRLSFGTLSEEQKYQLTTTPASTLAGLHRETGNITPSMLKSYSGVSQPLPSSQGGGGGTNRRLQPPLPSTLPQNLPKIPSQLPAATPAIHRDAHNPSPLSHITPATQYITFLSNLMTYSSIPYSSLFRIVRTLMLLLSEVMEDLPEIKAPPGAPANTASEYTMYRMENQSTSPAKDQTRSEPKSNDSHLEDAVWNVTMGLLNDSSYSSSTTRYVKRLLLDRDGSSSSLQTSSSASSLRARCAIGSARTIRRALRRAAEGRMTRNWLVNQTTFAYGNSLPAPFVPIYGTSFKEQDDFPRAAPVEDDLMNRAWGKDGEGGAWEIDKVAGAIPEAVREWVTRLRRTPLQDDDWVAGKSLERGGRRAEERVIIECLKAVCDLVDEGLQANSANDGADPGAAIRSFAALGVTEGHLVGSVLKEAVRCIENYSVSLPYMLQLSTALSRQPNGLLQILSDIILKLPGSQLLVDPPVAGQQVVNPSNPQAIQTTVSPSLHSIMLSIARHLSDETLSNLIKAFLLEGSLNPSSSEWLDNFSVIFIALEDYDQGLGSGAPTVHAILRPLARKALVQALSDTYHGVRDHRPHRLALLKLCLEMWERPGAGQELPIEDEISTILSDAIVAGAAEATHYEEPTKGRMTARTPTEVAPEEESSLEMNVRLLLCRLGRTSHPHHIAKSKISEELSTAAETPLSPSNRAPGGWSSLSSGIGSSPRSSTLSTTSATSEHASYRESVMPPLMSFVSAVATSAGIARDAGSHSVRVDVTNNSHGTPDRLSKPMALPLPHSATCRSLAAVLTLIRAFQQLAFSPPHSLTFTSPAARAPVSHQCIHVFRDLLALLGPSSTPPLTEEEKVWHERPTVETSATGIGQASCSRARLAILQWMVRLRADRDHRLYVLSDLDEQLEPLARLVGRCGASLPQEEDGIAVRNEITRSHLSGEGDKALPKRSRSTTRRTTIGTADAPRRSADHGLKDGSRERGSEPASMSPGHSSTHYTSVNPSAERIWFLPEHLPFAIPLGIRPSEGMTTYEAGRYSPDAMTASLWLPTSTYLCALIDIVKYEKDWELLSYALCHLPIQLSNKHLFCGPLSSRIVAKLAASLVDKIQSNALASDMELPSGIKATHVMAVAYQGVTILISYKKLFSRPLLDAMVETFQAGLNRSQATVKPCLHALTLAAFELQPQMTRSLSKILNQLSQMVTNPAVSIYILELLIILGSIPVLYANFTEEDYKRVFTVALKYIQHQNHPDARSSPGVSNALSQHLLAIAYYNIYVWFLALRQPERPKYIPHIIRNLLIANDQKGQKDIDERTEVCFDWLARYTYGDADPKPSRSFLGEVLSGDDVVTSEKHWMQGNAITTMRSLKHPGWIEVESRRPSGTVRLYCHLENAVELGSYIEGSSTAPSLLDGDLDSTRLVPSQSQNANQVSLLEDESGSENMASLTERARAGPAFPSRPKDVTVDPSYLAMLMSPLPSSKHPLFPSRLLSNTEELKRTIRTLDRTPVIDSHTIGILYVAPGQRNEQEILGNRHGSPAYARFLQGLGRLIKLKGQKDVYTGGLDSSNDEDGQYAYAWWDDIAQVLYHVATMMPNRMDDPQLAYKKRHVGNDHVRIIWNDSGAPYLFDTLKTDFQFANIVIEPHSAGANGAYSNSEHENEFFKVFCQRAREMPEFGPLGDFKVVSSESLSSFVRQVSILADFFAPVWEHTQRDTRVVEYVTNWRARLQTIKRFRAALPKQPDGEQEASNTSLVSQELTRDFTRMY